jgi:hypothetical protein
MMGSTSGMPANPIRPLGQFDNRSATNEMGKVLPLFYGRQRLGAQFISDFFDIKTVPQGSGGKSGTVTGANYYASFGVLVGHGAASKLIDLFFNGDSVYTDLTKIYAVSLAQTNNIATFQTKNAHGLTTGDSVSIYYAFQPEFNGEFTITVVSPTQFQYIIPGAIIPAETATAQNGRKIYALTHLDPLVAGTDLETQLTIPDFGTCEIAWGTQAQQPNTYMNSVSGIQHPAYTGQIRIVFHQIFLGFNQTNAQNVEAVFERIPTFDWMSNPAHALVDSNYGTCNPAAIVADLLLNPRAGLHLTEADLNLASFDAAQEQLFAEGVGLAPLWDRADELRSALLSVLENVDASLVPDSNGLLMLVLSRQPVSPPIVSDADLSALPEFPGEDWSNVVTRTYLTFVDPDAGWVKDIVCWSDTAAVEGKARSEPQTLDRPMVTSRPLANQLVALFGAIAALPKKTGKLSLVWDDDLYDALAPGNAFQFTYDLRPALNTIYRLTSRSIPDPAKPVFEVEVAIDRSYLYSPTMPSFDVQSKSIILGPVTPALQPIPAPPPSAIVELPVALCPDNQPAIAALVCRGTSSDTYASLFLGRNFVFNGSPPDSYLPLTIVKGFAMNGGLSADFLAATAFTAITNALPAEAANPNPFPLVDGLQLQLAGVDLVLPDVCDFDALANSLLLFVGNEIMSVAEATMNAAGAYTLTVIRGRFGTPIEDHHAGDEVWVVSLVDLRPLQHAHFLAGNDAQFKLTLGVQPVADVDAFAITFAGTRWNFPA